MRAGCSRREPASALPAAQLVKKVTLKIYANGDHGLADTRRDEISADLLAFLRS